MIYLLSGLLGFTFGSFANVCIYRLPKNKSVVKPRSFCPHCKKPIPARHNIPLISFLLLRARSACCRKPISWRYPLIETLFATLFIFHAWWFAETIEYLLVMNVFTFFLLTLSIIDYEHLIIPDELSLSLLVFGLLASFFNPYLPGTLWMKFLHSFFASIGGGLVMIFMAWSGEKLFHKEALGGGDVKLIAATCAILGWQGLYGPLFLGSFFGGLVGIFLLLTGKKKRGESIPFGPFLSFGAYVTALFPNVWLQLFNVN